MERWSGTWRVILGLVGAGALALHPGIVRADSAGVQAWNFRVLLNGREIGQHDFSLRTEGGTKVLRTEAAFKVKFLFITAYTYEHEAVEVWDQGCLRSIRSYTNDNGKEFDVRGEAGDSKFVVETLRDRREVEQCVSSFAYWNRDFLNQPRLLNSQTGELMSVKVEPLGDETITVGGAPVRAERFRLTAQGLAIDLWYGPDRTWLGLESALEGGRRLRYEPR